MRQGVPTRALVYHNKGQVDINISDGRKEPVTFRLTREEAFGLLDDLMFAVYEAKKYERSK